MKSLAARLLINLLTVIAVMLLLEVACRVALHYMYNRRFDAALIVDNKYGNTAGLKENAEGIVWGKKFTTDEFGCRKNKLAADKKKKKWLFIGDSVTEGVGVGDEETFASLCSEELKEYSLLNCSLIGYATPDYYNLLQSYLSAPDSSVELVTVFFCLNDVYGAAKTDNLPVMAKQDDAHRIATWLQQHYATYKLVKLFIYRNADNYFKYDVAFYKPDNERFKESMAYLQHCDSLCKSKGAYFNVVMLPYRSQLAGNNVANRTPQKMVGDFCDENGIEFSDATDLLAKEPSPQSLYLFADEIHFSAAGHKALAKYLLE